MIVLVACSAIVSSLLTRKTAIDSDAAKAVPHGGAGHNLFLGCGTLALGLARPVGVVGPIVIAGRRAVTLARGRALGPALPSAITLAQALLDGCAVAFGLAGPLGVVVLCLI